MSSIMPRPELQVRPGLLAFGLAVTEGKITASWPEVFDFVQRQTRSPSVQTVILDLRDINYLSHPIIAGLVRVNKLALDNGKPVALLLDDPTCIDVLRASRLDTIFHLVTNGRGLTELPTVGEAPARSPRDDPPPITAEEIAEMERAGISLGDVIRELENMRG